MGRHSGGTGLSRAGTGRSRVGDAPALQADHDARSPRPGRDGRLIRLGVLALVWLCGIAAGLFALLSAGARYTTCSAGSASLACTGSGTALGALLVVAVVAGVTVATLVSYGRERRTLLVIGGAALVLQLGLLLAAHALLATV